MDLNELRKQIDGIDDQLLELFLKRMEISKKVSEYKFQEHLPVLNQKREDEILANIAGKSGKYTNASQTLFATIMDISRALQHQLMGGGEGLRAQIKSAKDNKLLEAPSLACQGVFGAYSGIAGKSLFPQSEVSFYERFEDVFFAVENNIADYGIIPIENSCAGSVHESYDLMMKHKLYIVSGIDLPICHHLLAKKGTDISDIKRVFSHQQALSQCAQYITEHNFTPMPYYNTAAAAEMVATSPDCDIAAIASSDSAKLYGLSVLNDNIAASVHNSTRFIAISKNMIMDGQSDKISLTFGIPHTTGSLYRTLARFTLCGLNLTKIESRPIADSNFHYRFYLDFSGNVSKKETVDLLCALHDELPQFSFLGNYRELKI